MTIITLTAGIELAKAAYHLAAQQCLVVIENDTDELLVHQTYYAGHGNIAVLSELPAVPPRHRHGGDTYLFDEAVPLKNVGAPPAVVMLWKFLESDVWLLVFAYQAGAFGTNAAYYALKESSVDPEEFYKNAEKNTDWFYVGDVKEHCDTGALHGPTPVQGISIVGSANDENPMLFKVTVSA